MKRLLPEWEEQKFIQLVFPHKDTDWEEYLDEAIETFVNIAKIISKYQKCLIVAKDLKYIKSLFENHKFKRNLIFTKIDSNDTWSRDFAGITIEENNKLTLLNFKFNGWGKKYPYELDDKITQQLKLKGFFKNYKHKNINLVLEGGSIDVNTQGVLLTTTKCLMEKNRNPLLNKKTIEKTLINLFGVKKILWLNSGALSGDDTDSHIDTLARFVSNDTMVYQSCNNKNNPDYNELKKMEKELKTFTDIYGQKYKLIPLPNIDPIYEDDEQLPATYANFLIINDALLVPIYNIESDNIALDIFKKLFPTRDIIGINCSTLIKQHGSLHCVTMQYY